MKLKSSSQQRKVTRLMKQPIEWKKVSASYTSEKGLMIRIYSELKNHILQRIKHLPDKLSNELNRQFSKELQMVNKCMKKCSKFLAIKVM